jgi:AcrR family transcriptional regulator
MRGPFEGSDKPADSELLVRASSFARAGEIGFEPAYCAELTPKSMRIRIAVRLCIPGAVPGASPLVTDVREKEAEVASRNARRRLASRGELKRQRILDAAAKVLARRGYAGTQLWEIAAESKTQPGSLYYHFASREELIEEVLRKGVTLSFARSRAVVDALPAGASPLQRLEAALRAHLKFQLVESDYARAAVRSIGQYPSEMWARIIAEFRAYGRFFDGLIAASTKAGQLAPDVDRRALRMLILGAANWASEWYRPDGTSSVEEIGDLLVRLLPRAAGTCTTGVEPRRERARIVRSPLPNRRRARRV